MQVLTTVQSALDRGMREASAPVRESPGWRIAYVAMRLTERLEGVRDRRYVEQLDGTIALTEDTELHPEDY